MEALCLFSLLRGLGKDDLVALWPYDHNGDMSAK